MSETLDQVVARGRRETLPMEELRSWFAGLPAAPLAFMLGEWRGGVFPTGHAGEPLLAQLRWDGKTFASTEDVHPIVCLDGDGRRVVNPVMGAARLRLIPAPGETTPTAAMVYDAHPIIDHFKRLDDATVLGVMDRKGDAAPLYFWLRRLG